MVIHSTRDRGVVVLLLARLHVLLQYGYSVVEMLVIPTLSNFGSLLFRSKLSCRSTLTASFGVVLYRQDFMYSYNMAETENPITETQTSRPPLVNTDG